MPSVTSVHLPPVSSILGQQAALSPTIRFRTRTCSTMGPTLLWRFHSSPLPTEWESCCILWDTRAMAVHRLDCCLYLYFPGVDIDQRKFTRCEEKTSQGRTTRNPARTSLIFVRLRPRMYRPQSIFQLWTNANDLTGHQSPSRHRYGPAISAHPRFHPLPASPADHCRQALRPVAAGLHV